MSQAELCLSVETLAPCDRCERVVPCGWFGSFLLCPECVLVAAEALGKEAAGRAIERIAQLHERETRLAQNMNRLLERIGDRGQCRGCRATIYWAKHKATPNNPAGAATPYDFDGTNHFVTCPAREQFRRPKAQGAR